MITLFENTRCTLSSNGKVTLKKSESSQQVSPIKKIHLMNGSLAYGDGKSQFDLVNFNDNCIMIPCESCGLHNQNINLIFVFGC